jgi:hypothetical protein
MCSKTPEAQTCHKGSPPLFNGQEGNVAASLIEPAFEKDQLFVKSTLGEEFDYSMSNLYTSLLGCFILVYCTAS